MKRVKRSKAIEAAKPTRKAFTKQVVLYPNGSEVPTDVVSQIAGNTKNNKTFKMVLRREGMQVINLFQPDAFSKANQEYLAHKKASVVEQKEQIVHDALEQAHLGSNKKLEGVLKTMLPLYQGKSPRHTVISLRRVLNVVAKGTDLRAQASQ